MEDSQASEEAITKRRWWLRWGGLGPGLAFLAAMTGPGSIVSNAAAGASYGYSLLWALALALLFRYVWVDASARYVLITRESLLQGYARIGRWLVWTILGAALLMLANDRTLMGKHRNGWLSNLAMGLMLVVSVYLTVRTGLDVWLSLMRG